jgi:hypothetical protein
MTVRLQSWRDLAEQMRLRAHDLAAGPTWSQVAIPVAGGPVAFEWLAEGHHWMAPAELDDHTLTVT